MVRPRLQKSRPLRPRTRQRRTFAARRRRLFRRPARRISPPVGQRHLDQHRSRRRQTRRHHRLVALGSQRLPRYRRIYRKCLQPLLLSRHPRARLGSTNHGMAAGVCQPVRRSSTIAGARLLAPGNGDDRRSRPSDKINSPAQTLRLRVADSAQQRVGGSRRLEYARVGKPSSLARGGVGGRVGTDAVCGARYGHGHSPAERSQCRWLRQRHSLSRQNATGGGERDSAAGGADLGRGKRQCDDVRVF